MGFDKKEVLESLKLEIQMIERGGYNPSVRDPRREIRIFRDSVSCPNLGLLEKVTPCAHCFLMEFVPPEHRAKDDACHYIPLNDCGDTVASLAAEDNAEKTQGLVLNWLRRAVTRLEEELAAQPARG